MHIYTFVVFLDVPEATDSRTKEYDGHERKYSLLIPSLPLQLQSEGISDKAVDTCLIISHYRSIVCNYGLMCAITSK